jgi:hypothetical protein
MSVKVSSWVWHGEETAELAGNEMILLLALADVADDNGRCVYLTEEDDLTYGALAEKARVDRRTVIRLVAKLRERGLLTQKRGTRAQPNEFAIAVPWRRGDKLSPVDSVTSDADSVTNRALIGDNARTRTSLIRTDVDTSSSEAADAPLRDDVKRLLDLLDSEIERNGGRKPSRTKKNIDAARLLLDRDGKTVEQVEAAIRWSQGDEFWRSNILSMSKLREKYETLRLQAKRQQGMSSVDAGRQADAILAAQEQQRLAVSA